MTEADDYYSYKPRVRLERPVALVGLPGCRTMQTTRVATMITGLSACLLPRLVSHATEVHPEGLMITGRSAELHAAELKLLRISFGKRAPEVIALGPTTLDDPACRALLVENADIVHLKQTLAEALHNLQDDLVQDPRKHQHLRAHGVISEDSMRDLFAARTALFERLATTTVALDHRPPLKVGRTLPGMLGWT